MKGFLARILKGTVKELAQLDVETIIRECLTEEPAISTVPVDRDAVKYPVEKRAIYYTSRLISAQKGVVFESDDYEKIRWSRKIRRGFCRRSIKSP